MALKNFAYFDRVARLTNTHHRLHCPSLRARRTQASHSKVRECEADWSATCDEFSQEDTSRRCRARRTRSSGEENHQGSIRSTPSVDVNGDAKALLGVTKSSVGSREYRGSSKRKRANVFDQRAAGLRLGRCGVYTHSHTPASSD